MSLLPHQHRALVYVLKRSDFNKLSANTAFSRLLADKDFYGLRPMRFLTEAQYNGMHPKRRPAVYCSITEQEAAFPGGLPGFPNKLRRDWFDAAWKEARGG